MIADKSRGRPVRALRRAGRQHAVLPGDRSGQGAREDDEQAHLRFGRVSSSRGAGCGWSN